MEFATLYLLCTLGQLYTDLIKSALVDENVSCSVFLVNILGGTASAIYFIPISCLSDFSRASFLSTVLFRST